MSIADEPHGTQRKYDWERRTFGEACEVCLAGATAERKAQRNAAGQSRATQKARLAARGRAMARLAALHVEELARLIEEELSK